MRQQTAGPLGRSRRGARLAHETFRTLRSRIPTTYGSSAAVRLRRRLKVPPIWITTRASRWLREGADKMRNRRWAQRPW
jgi:hypothetical protein